jgi:hypothetical protein
VTEILQQNTKHSEYRINLSLRCTQSGLVPTATAPLQLWLCCLALQSFDKGKLQLHTGMEDIPMDTSMAPASITMNRQLTTQQPSNAMAGPVAAAAGKALPLHWLLAMALVSRMTQ